MNFLGRLFGTEKALSAVVDGVSNGLDALVYTDEEKANDAAAERSEGRKMVVEWMRATQGQNLSRRLIALSITGVWLFMKLLATFIGVVAVYSTDAARLGEVIKLVNELSADMTSAVMLILAFYFAAPHMGGIAKAVTQRFTKAIIEKPSPKIVSYPDRSQYPDPEPPKSDRPLSEEP